MSEYQKITQYFHSWRVAYAYVVGRKNTNNDTLSFLLKSKTNKGSNLKFR